MIDTSVAYARRKREQNKKQPKVQPPGNRGTEAMEEQALGKTKDIRLLARLIPFMAPFRWRILVAVILVFGSTAVDLTIPYITKTAIDRYIVPPQQSGKVRLVEVNSSDENAMAVIKARPDLFKPTDTGYGIRFSDLNRLSSKELAAVRRADIRGLSLAAGILLAFVACGFFFTFLQVWIIESAGQRIMGALRIRLFSHLLNLDTSFFNRQPLGRLVTRVTNDVQNMNEFFTSVVTMVFKDLFLLIGIAGMLIWLSWELALVVFTVLPFVGLASLRFSHLARRGFREVRVLAAKINTIVSETVGGIRVIQLFLREKDNFNRFSKVNHDNYLASIRLIHVFALFMPVIEVLGSVAVALIIWYGGGKAVSGHISLGALVAFISYIRMFFRPIRDIAEKYNILQNAMSSAERIFLLFDTGRATPRGSLGLPGKGIERVCLERVSFSYVPEEPVLSQVNLEIEKGKKVAVVGPTGAGKTTLIHLITGLYQPDSGQIRINGQDLSTTDPDAVRAKIALVAQDPVIFSGTLEENILMGALPGQSVDVPSLLEAAQLTDLVTRLPEGVHTRFSEFGSALSSGERQLISMARALARNPDLICLDEATSYVDSITEEKIQKALAHLLRGRSALIVAHRLSTAKTADRILVMSRGKVAESGTHTELMAKKGLYYRLSMAEK